MPGKIQINKVTGMGAVLTADDTAIIGNNAATVEVRTFLASLAAAKVISTPKEKAASATSWTNGGTRFTFGCADRTVAKRITSCIQLLDNEQFAV